jgi:hypothetical protein
MNVSAAILTLFVFIIVAVLLVLFSRRLAGGAEVGLRPLPSYLALKSQIGRAVENGRRVHFAMGRASLLGPASPTSLASLTALNRLARDGCASGVPPLVAVGEGSLLPAAQDTLRAGYRRAERADEFSLASAQFLAPETAPFAYAAGVTDLMVQQQVGSNLMLGRFGSELALMSEAAVRADTEQVIGSDDPVALSVGAAVTDHLIIGEELLAAHAYLEGQPQQVAAIQLQDLLRLIIVVLILLAALAGIIAG